MFSRLIGGNNNDDDRNDKGNNSKTLFFATTTKLNDYYVPDTELTTLQIVSHIILITFLQDRYDYIYQFVDELVDGDIKK